MNSSLPRIALPTANIAGFSPTRKVNAKPLFAGQPSSSVDPQSPIAKPIQFGRAEKDSNKVGMMMNYAAAAASGVIAVIFGVVPFVGNAVTSHELDNSPVGANLNC